jgi:hypothetical protein
MALVQVHGTRARRAERALVGEDPDARAAIEALVRARLVVARDTEAGAAYEIAHDALLKDWSTLRRWRDEHVAARAVEHPLVSAATAWPREIAPLTERRGEARRRFPLVHAGLLALLALALSLAWSAALPAARWALKRVASTHVIDARAALGEAELIVETEPAAARVSLARFEADDAGRLRLGEARALGISPTPPVEVPRGSYVIDIEAAGRAPVHYPILIGPERAHVTIALPLAMEPTPAVCASICAP